MRVALQLLLTEHGGDKLEIKSVSVSQINQYIKKLIDSNGVLSNFWICGEISNFKHHYYGHMYLTLKDEQSAIKAVMFKSFAETLEFEPEDGIKILARGRLSVYEAAGTYQFYIEEMIPDGRGYFQEKFEKLKKRFEQEGLFDELKKKNIPDYPERIGVCTAVTGAAVQDIINVISRRFPISEIIIYPTIVQGENAAKSICEAIKWFNKNKAADVLIVGRGGGSIEDLWAFNEESVAYAIYESEIPLISAVGHETDFTIADYVADLRAPTPSAAAEIAVPNKEELQEKILVMTERLESIIKAEIEHYNLLVSRLKPTNPKDIIYNYSVKNDYLLKQLEDLMKLKINKLSGEFSAAVRGLDALSPLSVLSRGYSIAHDGNGKIYKNSKDLKKDTDFILKFHDGDVNCIVNK